MSDKLVFKQISFKNFLSFGNSTTSVDLDNATMTVVIGENMDTGGHDSRNGVGKSAIGDAICYALFGKVIRGISNPKLVNKLARKGQSMIVQLEFIKGEYAYMIERGESPSVLKLFRKPIENKDSFRVKDGKTYKYDISRNKTETTDQIQELLGFDIKLFEFLVLNSSESDAFMKLSEEKKRDVIEKLFGFDILTIKAKKLKDEKKKLKLDLVSEDTAIKTKREANERIKAELSSLKNKQEQWEADRESTINELQEIIDELSKINVADEIDTLKELDELNGAINQIKVEISEKSSIITEANSLIREQSSIIERMNREMSTTIESIESIDKSICPTCKQHWVADPSERNKLTDYVEECDTNVVEAEETINEALPILEDAEKEVEELNESKEEGLNEINRLKEKNLFYDNIEDAASAETTLKKLKENLDKEKSSENPHTDTIKDMENRAIVEVNMDRLQELVLSIKHYDVLISLLTDKDSYLRKAIIDQWLPKLNYSINTYLDVLELPHRVKFRPDMTMHITHINEEFDWGNLSKGQRQRVSLAIDWAFQDVFEWLNYPINLLMVDEMLDSGICNRGAANAVTTLERMVADKNKRVLLVTHREDIASQISDVMNVVIENNISRIDNGDEEDCEHQWYED